MIFRYFKMVISGVAALLGVLFAGPSAYALPDIVFVTQPPFPDDYTTTNSVFGNHLSLLLRVPRGGDLYIRYSDGRLRNLTAEAGFGGQGMVTGQKGIAVRDPEISWDGKTILFSMLIGVPSQRYQDVPSVRWQIYEARNFRPGEKVTITRVASQPAQYNNVMPAYMSDDRIIFVSDQPAGNRTDLYPQRDEYESADSNTGLWTLNRTTHSVVQLDHAPSGDFDPMIDSFGRVVFTRWDHLQRDQQRLDARFQSYNYASEAADAAILPATETFPEPQFSYDPDKQANVDGLRFNHFFPWSMAQDGTGLETLNHIGRHELFSFIGRSFNDDPNIQEYYGQYTRTNQNPIETFLYIRESNLVKGKYFGINGPEFGTHGAGQIVSLSAPPALKAGDAKISYITARSTSAPGSANDHSGFYRDPIELSTGRIIASHTENKTEDQNIGTSLSPRSRYAFRLKTLANSGGVYKPSTNLTPGIIKSVSYWNPDNIIEFKNVTMWELQPVEVRVRSRPVQVSALLPQPELAAFQAAGVDPVQFTSFLRTNKLSLLVTRNVTSRDSMDLQQPFNLAVDGGPTVSSTGVGKIYSVSFLQFFQGDRLRGYAGIPTMTQGRRVLATPMHDATSYNPPNGSGPSGSVRIASDGSTAAIVPATRPLTWQLTDKNGRSIVRERYWVTFQPGEVRVCTSCHGLSKHDQLGRDEPQNTSQALILLLQNWKQGIH